MTHIVPRNEQAAPPHPVAGVVLDLSVTRKARAMRTAMAKVASESADQNVTQPVMALALRCNDKMFARMFDIAAAHASVVSAGA